MVALQLDSEFQDKMEQLLVAVIPGPALLVHLVLGPVHKGADELMDPGLGLLPGDRLLLELSTDCFDLLAQFLGELAVPLLPVLAPLEQGVLQLRQLGLQQGLDLLQGGFPLGLLELDLPGQFSHPALEVHGDLVLVVLADGHRVFNRHLKPPNDLSLLPGAVLQPRSFSTRMPS